MKKEIIQQTNYDFEKSAKAFPNALDILISVSQGGVFTDKRYDAAKTIFNGYVKLNMSESAKEATRAMISQKRSKTEKEFEDSMNDYGLLPEKEVKKLTK